MEGRCDSGLASLPLVFLGVNSALLLLLGLLGAVDVGVVGSWVDASAAVGAGGPSVLRRGEGVGDGATVSACLVMPLGVLRHLGWSGLRGRGEVHAARGCGPCWGSGLGLVLDDVGQ